MRILVDVDGVQADLAPRFLQVLYRLTGQRWTTDSWTDWSPAKAGLCTDAQAAQIFDALSDSVDLLPDVQGAVDGVRALRQAGHRCVALTSPVITPGWLHGRVKWLHSRGFGNEDIVLAWDKALVPGDVMIDDNADYANAWAEAHPYSMALLFDAPWNNSVSRAPSNAVRVHSWPEVVVRVGDRAKQVNKARGRLGLAPLVSKPLHSADCFGYPCVDGEICR